jgi:hypothetical protein
VGGRTAIRLLTAFRRRRAAGSLGETRKEAMNDYLTAIATAEMTRNRPRAAWTHHRPYPRRRRRALGVRIAALLQIAPAGRAAAVPS